MKTEAVNPFTLPSLPLAARKQLPDCPAIYFVLEGDAVLYVGKTRNLQQRWIAHHRWHQLKELDGDVRIAWLECSETALLADIEEALIAYFQPSLNRAPVASKLPRMIVYLEPELKEAAEKLAKKQRRSVSSLVCLLLEQAVADAQGAPSDGQ